ncbi:hypothetical protein AYO49_03465 [Verrucomicrobiaceae bacterium SCGC AG-212-N21]|nr:hypothetical protein AYO49_03465 [Verrucomicrobiaceae bacterium SCGC AG-212-N21]
MIARLLPLLLFVATSSSGLAAEPEKLALQHQWEVGKRYHFDTSFEIENTFNAVNVSTLSIVLKFDAAVTKEAGADRKLVEVTFTDIKVIMNNGGAITSYDSARPEMSPPAMQKEFGIVIGKGFTWVYDKDDQYVDAIPQPGFTVAGQDARGMADALRRDFELGMPKEGLSVGDAFSVVKDTGSNMFGPIVARMEGRLDSIVKHEGRDHARIVMDGHTVMKDKNGADAPQAGTKNSEDILFDLERKRITRHLTKAYSNYGGEVGKTERITTLKGVSEVRVASE